MRDESVHASPTDQEQFAAWPVLIVDDEPDIQFSVRCALAPAGFEIIEASGGIEALDTLSSMYVALVLLDIAMPRLDGWDTLRRIRAAYPSLPVIMLSARYQEDSKLLAFQLGADDYIVKPFSSAELTSRIRAHLRRRNLSLDPRLPVPVGNDPLLLVPEQQTASYRGGSSVRLPGRQFAILQLLHGRPGEPVSVDEIIQALWKVPPENFSGAVKSTVHRIRRAMQWGVGGPLVAVSDGYMYLPEFGPHSN